MNNQPQPRAWKRFILYFGGLKGGLFLAVFIWGGEFVSFLLFPANDFAGFMWVTIHFVIGPPLAAIYILLTFSKLFMVSQWTSRLACVIITVPFFWYIFMAATGDPRWVIWLMPNR